MRLIEEKNLMIANMIALITIVSTTLFIQISDYKIETEADLLMERVLIMLQKNQFKLNHESKSKFYIIFRALNITSHINKDEKDDGIYPSDSEYLPMHEEKKRLRDKYAKNELSPEEYTDALIEHHRKQSEHFREEYNRMRKKLVNTEPTVWHQIRIISIIVQVIGICFLAFSYGNLTLMIRNRLLSKK